MNSLMCYTKLLSNVIFFVSCKIFRHLLNKLKFQNQMIEFTMCAKFIKWKRDMSEIYQKLRALIDAFR